MFPPYNNIVSKRILSVTGYTCTARAWAQLQAMLGASQVQTLRFTHFAKVKADYACSLAAGAAGAFAVDAKLSAPPATSDAGVEVELTVTYEPSEIGESRDTLKIASPQGGEYVFPLRGVCVAPKPQGPIMVKAGGSAVIPFKNVFATQQEFRITVDSPLFQVKDKEVVPAKKPLAINVAFKPTPDVKKEVTAKLTIVCGSQPPWVFYLKGTAS